MTYSKVVTFTGHRPDKITNRDSQKSLLLELLSKLDLSSTLFRVGGCPGFDTIALESLIELGVPLNQITLMVPFKGFEKYAGHSHTAENSRVLKYNADLVDQGLTLIECGGYGTFGQKCYSRNQSLVDCADIIFTNWDGTPGGTANTIKLAKQAKLSIININGEGDHNDL